MADLSTKVRLRNGVQVPILGLGTTHSGGYIHDTVVYALKECGYRHLDTAKRYGVESFLAQAIKDSHVDRGDIFLTTKLWPTDYGKDKTQKAAFESMKRLDTDYLDLYVMHLPVCPSSIESTKKVIQETWRELELLLDQEKIRSVGVSNFQVSDLEDLIDSMETSDTLPHVNQCEFHPCQNPEELVKFCLKNQIQFGGFCPLAKGRLLHLEPVIKIAKEIGKTPAQVLIRWSIQHEVLTIPKSTKKEHISENYDSLNFKLNDGAMNVLDELHNNLRVVPIENLRQKLDTNLKDGYKLNNSYCNLPQSNNI